MSAGTTISTFNFKNIPQIVSLVKPMWTDPSMRESYARYYAELILRSNIFENNFRLQLENENKFCSAAFGTVKGEKNLAREWLKSIIQNETFSQEEILWFKRCLNYIENNDKKLQSYMTETDIQLSLFVSTIKGCGKPVLEEFLQRARSNGFHRLFLWTDIECNWQYYPEQGFELIEEAVYDLYSKPDQPYKVFFYKKAL